MNTSHPDYWTLTDLENRFEGISKKFWYKIFSEKYLGEDLKPFRDKGQSRSILIKPAGAMPILQIIADLKKENYPVDVITRKVRESLGNDTKQSLDTRGNNAHVTETKESAKPLMKNDSRLVPRGGQSREDLWDKLLTAEKGKIKAETQLEYIQGTLKLLTDGRETEKHLRKLQLSQAKEIREDKQVLWKQYKNLGWWQGGQKRETLKEIDSLDLKLINILETPSQESPQGF
jgi:hypothetical protein